MQKHWHLFSQRPELADAIQKRMDEYEKYAAEGKTPYDDTIWLLMTKRKRQFEAVPVFGHVYRGLRALKHRFAGH